MGAVAVRRVDQYLARERDRLTITVEHSAKAKRPRGDGLRGISALFTDARGPRLAPVDCLLPRCRMAHASPGMRDGVPILTACRGRAFD